MRIEKSFHITGNIKQQIVHWANNQGENMIWLDSNAYADVYHKFDAVLAFAPNAILRLDTPLGAFDALRSFVDKTRDWIFGYLSYDLKNDVASLKSNNFDGLQFPELYFFQPQKLLFFRENMVMFSYLSSVSSEIEADWKAMLTAEMFPFSEVSEPNAITARLSKADYMDRVRKMQEHIARGDIYEANFCQEFYVEDVQIDPISTYFRLNSISTPPFACYLRFDDCFVMSASPERYLQRTRETVISQPIKGTARRSSDVETDRKLRDELEQNPKERSENVMIVDLVRNDLSMYAQKGSVEVRELCKPYTFKQVHQLISTIATKIKDGTHAVDVLKSTFPMGSMTGAPKLSAMQIIEKLEASKRGIYSGAIGYFTPTADFDFNVVIRSIFYNQKKKYVSFSVGSAITAVSDPEKEYEECLVKANAMKKVLEER